MKTSLNHQNLHGVEEAQTQTTNFKDLHAELDLTFHEMNSKEHIWSRLKALQLYEQANIFLLVYNADSRESFEALKSIYADFKESNSLDCYVVLCSIISHDIILRRTQKVIKKTEA